jgi:hypothetical protein
VNLIGCVRVTKLLDERAPDEAGSARDQHLHGRRVYWRACALLAVAALAGCDHGNKRTEPPPLPTAKLSFVELDREQQQLVADYRPASVALTAYELAFRDWRLGRLTQAQLLSAAHSYRSVVLRAADRVRRDTVSGESRRARRLFVQGLAARAAALSSLPSLAEYQRRWNRSVVDARAGLTILQDVRDRARLIPLPEDSVS